MNLLDKAISWVSPETGLRRTRARIATQAMLAYEGATVGRRTDGWAATSTSANAEIGPSLAKLRDRSRQLVRDNPYAARTMDELVSQTIGTGIQAQAKTESDPENKIIDGVWSQWMDECDADGQLDFCGIQDLVTRMMLESGETLIRFRPRFVADGFRVPLQIQVIEPDLLDLGKTAKVAGGYIIQGVEFDLVGRRVAYWLFPEHPGDSISTTQFSNAASKRIPADQILHIYRKRRGNQTRGVPLLAPVMLALRDLDEYQDAERVRKKIEACLSLFVSPPEGQENSTFGATSTEEGTGKRIEEFRPGMIMYGRNGEKAEFFAPTGAGGYGEFVRQNERMIATGVGLTYAKLTGDLSDVNYSSYKAGDLSFQRLVECLRWLTLIPMFLRPVRERFIEMAYAAGQIPNAESYKTEWTPPAFGSVDPLKDAEAAEVDLRIGRRTWPQAVAEQGYDPQEQINEIEKWKPELEKAGVDFSGKAGANAQSQRATNPNPAD